MSPTVPGGGFDAVPSSSAVRITIDGDPAIVLVIDPAPAAPGAAVPAGLEAFEPSSEPGLPARSDAGRAGGGPPDPPDDPPAPVPARPPDAGLPRPSASRAAMGSKGDPGVLADGPDVPGASPGRPLIRSMPPSRGQPPGTARLEIIVDGWRFEAVVEPARRAMLRDLARRERGTAGEGPQVVRAPLPGRIVRVWVNAGDAVEAGAPLCSLEAMKMENEIRAARAGTIERVSVTAGAHVEHGDELVVIG